MMHLGWALHHNNIVGTMRWTLVGTIFYQDNVVDTTMPT